MYKDDNFLTREGCSEALLRTLIDGRSGDPSPNRNKVPCNEGDTSPRETWGIPSYPLASVYAPLQEFKNTYDLDTALREGTIFTELNLPFMGRRIDKGGKCCG